MTSYNIEAVLNTRMEEFRASYPIDVVYTNTDYVPTTGVDFIKVDCLVGNSQSTSLGLDSFNRINGIYQLTIATESSKGQAKVKTIVEKLHDFFKRGTGIVVDDVGVRVLRFRIGPYSESPSWFTQIIRVEFRSDIPN